MSELEGGGVFENVEVFLDDNLLLEDIDPGWKPLHCKKCNAIFGKCRPPHAAMLVGTDLCNKCRRDEITLDCRSVR